MAQDRYYERAAVVEWWRVNKEAHMARLDECSTVSLQELVVSSLAQTDALTKLLIEKGLITAAEFMQELSEERAGYRAVLQEMSQVRRS